MRFSSSVEIITALIIISLLLFISRKIIKSALNKVIKIILCIILVILSLPAWYFSLIPTYNGLRLFINLTPFSKTASCGLLYPKQCKNREDCSVFYTTGSTECGSIKR